MIKIKSKNVNTELLKFLVQNNIEFDKGTKKKIIKDEKVSNEIIPDELPEIQKQKKPKKSEEKVVRDYLLDYKNKNEELIKAKMEKMKAAREAKKIPKL